VVSEKHWLSGKALMFKTGPVRQSISPNGFDQPPVLWKLVLSNTDFLTCGARLLAATKLP
jgi:hypothetical protein